MTNNVIPLPWNHHCRVGNRLYIDPERPNTEHTRRVAGRAIPFRVETRTFRKSRIEHFGDFHVSIDTGLELHPRLYRRSSTRKTLGVRRVCGEVFSRSQCHCVVRIPRAPLSRCVGNEHQQDRDNDRNADERTRDHPDALQRLPGQRRGSSGGEGALGYGCGYG